MAAQQVFEAHLPLDRLATWEDLQGLPDDHYRYELIEGTLLVTPSPGSAHQSVVLLLATVLLAARPPHLVVKVAPFDVVPRPGESYQPDILVARREDVGAQRIDVAPLLVVEVQSPSTRILDVTSKRRVYANLEVEHYWLVDPLTPTVVAMRLSGDDFVEVARAVGEAVLAVDEPFPVQVVPSSLLTE